MLYYVHGYGSGPDGTKAKLLREKLGAVPIRYMEEEELDISRCTENIENAIKNDIRVVLIGSSLGGFLSARVALDNRNVKGLVLLNPAVIPPDSEVKNSPLPEKAIQEMKDTPLFQMRIPCDIFIIRSTGDELIPNEWVLKFAMFQEATVKFIDDDHRINRNLHRLPEMISQFLKSRNLNFIPQSWR